jgi:hypothetical protein
MRWSVLSLPLALSFFTACSSTSTSADGGTDAQTGDGQSGGDAAMGGATKLTASKSMPDAACSGVITVTSVKAEDAGGTISPALTRVTVLGTTGTAAHEIKLYFETASGKLTNVSDTCAMNVAFCEADPVPDPNGMTGTKCMGATHDAAKKQIALAATGLTGTFPAASSVTLDGTIQY